MQKVVDLALSTKNSRLFRGIATYKDIGEPDGI